jgi:hypothetical protein
LHTLLWHWRDFLRRQRPSSLFFRLAVLVVSVGAASSAWAQTYYPFDMPGTISFGNFNFTLGTCTYRLNNGASTSCANDNLEMTVTTTKNSVTLAYVNSSNPGTPLLSQAGANGCTCIQFELTVSDSYGISKATVSDTGIGRSGSTLTNWLETYGTTTKLAQADIMTAGSQSASGAYSPTGNPTSLNLELGLGVNAAYQPGVLSLNSGSITFTQAPEPRAISVFLTGFGCLIMLRRRGRARATAGSAGTPKVSRRSLMLGSGSRDDWTRSHAGRVTVSVG